MALGRDAIVAKVQRYIPMCVVIDPDLVALEQQPIFFARKIIAPQTLFSAYHEISVIPAFCPRERRRRIESNPFSPKSDFARFQDNQKNDITEGGREHSAKAGREPRIGSHQSWDRRTANGARDYSADRYPVWNNEMLKIDKRSDDEEGNKNPVRDRHLPREAFPDCEKKKRGNQLDGEIPKRNFGAAVCATTAKHDPADQRQILMPWNRLLAVRAKRPAGPVDRKINRPAVNADVQKGADRSAKHKRERAEEKLVRRVVHAISLRTISSVGAP